MNIRSILTRGHWLRTPEGKYPLIFLEAKKERLRIIYLDGEILKTLDIYVMNLKYDRVTEKYYLQFSANEYLQFQLLKPGEHRHQRRSLQSALDTVSSQLIGQPPAEHSSKIAESLIREALQSTKYAGGTLPEMLEINNYYLGKAAYLGMQKIKR